jgi:hypothetical protein
VVESVVDVGRTSGYENCGFGLGARRRSLGIGGWTSEDWIKVNSEKSAYSACTGCTHFSVVNLFSL